jgi:hypothetical protein
MAAEATSLLKFLNKLELSRNILKKEIDLSVKAGLRISDNQL